MGSPLIPDNRPLSSPSFGSRVLLSMAEAFEIVEIPAVRAATNVYITLAFCPPAGG